MNKLNKKILQKRNSAAKKKLLSTFKFYKELEIITEQAVRFNNSHRPKSFDELNLRSLRRGIRLINLELKRKGGVARYLGQTAFQRLGTIHFVMNSYSDNILDRKDPVRAILTGKLDFTDYTLIEP